MSGVGAVCAGLLSACALFAFHQVPDGVTPADARAVQRLIPEPPTKPHSFEDEVALILSIQDRVLAASPEERGIALNRPREIADLLRARHGACFDRTGNIFVVEWVEVGRVTKLRKV